MLYLCVQALFYHPAVAALYQDEGACNLYPPLVAPHSDVEMRRQFITAEQQQQLVCPWLSSLSLSGMRYAHEPLLCMAGPN